MSQAYDGSVSALALSARPSCDLGSTQVFFRADAQGWALMIERAVNEGLPITAVLDALPLRLIETYVKHHTTQGWN